MTDTDTKKQFYSRPAFVFASLWLIVFALYAPARNAGWVSDTCEWLQKIRTQTFADFINTKQSRGSLYQFTQLSTYVFYKIFKEQRWAWHILFVTLHAINCTLLFIICKQLFERSSVKNAVFIAYGAVILFSINPHVSEVIVWKASYHYLQALFLMLVILYLAQRFIDTGRTKYALFGVALFFLSTFSHEFFFLTPFFVLTLALYSRFILNADKIIFKKTISYFVAPLILLFLFHLALVYINTNNFSGELGDEINQPISEYLRKPPSYLFHILFFGRFFSPQSRQVVYDFFVSKAGLISFYVLLTIACTYFFTRFRHLKPNSKVVSIIFVWSLMCMAIASPMWFGYIQTVQFDRYAYFMLPFIYLLLMLSFASIKFKDITITAIIIYAFINIYFTLRVNKYWGQSNAVVNNLLHSFPEAGNKTILLLNVPANINGVPMVGPFLHFSFRQMHNLENIRQVSNITYDVVSYNMLTPNDGAHVLVINDSMLHVTLNQWGTWWWYGMIGAFSHQNDDYKVNMIDAGHWYELTLKHPASQYLLLYQVGGKWKTVDWSLRNDQY